MSRLVRLLLVSGSTRSASTNTAALRTVQAAAPDPVSTSMYEGMADLDWTVGGGALYGKPVAWINVAAESRGTNAEASLASVLGYVGATLDEACVRLPLARDAIGPDGTVADMDFRRHVAEVVETIVQFLERTEA